jgi:co-chaperonin GroES (HSP10)
MDFQEINRLESDVTEANAADPLHLPEVLGPTLLLRQVNVQEKTSGGIILAVKTVQEYEYVTNVARVLALGDMAYTHEKFRGNIWVKPGDFVVFRREAPILRFKCEGVNLTLLKDDAVLMKVVSPEQIASFIGHQANDYLD